MVEVLLYNMTDFLYILECKYIMVEVLLYNMTDFLYILERKYIMVGDSSYNMTGTVTSTFFPNNYIQNGEQVTFQFTSRLLTDKVVLSFDDFDIAPGGAFYVSCVNVNTYLK
jgi:hypothetical protein